MAMRLQPGLTPSEVAFLCEMETVTVIPRQRLEGLQLLGVSESALPQTERFTALYVLFRFAVQPCPLGLWKRELTWKRA